MGIVINGCFAQMIDLMSGFVGFDAAGDDGYKFGRWPWQTNRRMVARETGIQGAAPAAEPKPKVEETPKPKVEEKPKPKAEGAPKAEETPKPKTDEPTKPKTETK